MPQLARDAASVGMQTNYEALLSSNRFHDFPVLQESVWRGLAAAGDKAIREEQQRQETQRAEEEARVAAQREEEETAMSLLRLIAEEEAAMRQIVAGCAGRDPAAKC